MFRRISRAAVLALLLAAAAQAELPSGIEEYFDKADAARLEAIATIERMTRDGERILIKVRTSKDLTKEQKKSETKEGVALLAEGKEILKTLREYSQPQTGVVLDGDVKPGQVGWLPLPLSIIEVIGEEHLIAKSESGLVLVLNWPTVGARERRGSWVKGKKIEAAPTEPGDNGAVEYQQAMYVAGFTTWGEEKYPLFKPVDTNEFQTAWLADRAVRLAAQKGSK